MSLHPIRLLLLQAVLLMAASLTAQELPPGTPAAPAAALVPAAALQQKTKEWILARKLIGEESAAWQAEKLTLSELNQIRAKEASQLDEFVKAAGARVDELTKQKDASSKEREALRKWRGDFEATFVKLEAEAKALSPRFPTPLRDKVEDAILRLEGGDSDRPLQDRVRDVLLILQSAKEFDDTFTVTSEIREIEGRKVEVRILYLGLSQAWYVDAGATHGGYGLPAASGWVWTEDRSIAPAVRDAIAIQTGEATAAFVTLPFIPLSSSPAAASR